VQSFSGAGASFAAGTEHVVWAADFLVQKDCSTVTVAAWTGKVAMDISQYGGVRRFLFLSFQFYFLFCFLFEFLLRLFLLLLLLLL